jgi:hypothetical protein
MRYTTLLTSIEKATAKYEATIQRLLSRYAKADSRNRRNSIGRSAQRTRREWRSS